MRTEALLVGVLVVLAGCLGGAAPGTDGDASPADTESGTATTAPDPGTTTTRTPTVTTARPPCEEPVVTTVDPVRDDVNPGQLPDRPDLSNETDVRSFAAEYERTYRRNLGLEADTSTYEVYTSNTTVRTADGGYVVTMTVGFWYNVAEPTNGTVTPTVVHADGPEYRVAYFVTDDRVRRDSALEDDSLTPRRGTTVECWRAG